MPFGTHLLLFKHIRFVPAQKNAENTKGRGSDIIHGLTINSAHRRMVTQISVHPYTAFDHYPPMRKKLTLSDSAPHNVSSSAFVRSRFFFSFDQFSDRS